MNSLYILFIGEFFLLLWVLTFTKTDIICPSFITVLMFFLSTVCIMWNEKYWGVEFKIKTTLVVLFGLFLICFLEYFVKILYVKKSYYIWKDKTDYFQFTSMEMSKGMGVIFTFFTTLLMVIYILGVFRSGGTTSLLKAIGVVHNNSESSVGLLPTIAIRILNKIAYPCVFIMAYNAVKGNLKRNMWLLIPTIESCIGIFFSGVRSTFMYVIFAFIVYYIIFYRFKNGWRSVKLKTYIKPLFIMTVIFLIVFVGSRSIVKNREYTSSILEYITFYLGSPLHLFNRIIDNLDMGLPLAQGSYVGTYSFTWLYQELYKFGILGKDTIDATRFVAVGGSYYGGGNVFTIFSSAMQDFGLFGMYVYILVIYYLILRCYYKNFKYNRFIKKSEIKLLVFGYFSNYYLMAFYCALSKQFKIQTILEIFIMIVVYKCLMKYKVKFK